VNPSRYRVAAPRYPASYQRDPHRPCCRHIATQNQTGDSASDREDGRCTDNTHPYRSNPSTAACHPIRSQPRYGAVGSPHRRLRTTDMPPRHQRAPCNSKTCPMDRQTRTACRCGVGHSDSAAHGSRHRVPHRRASALLASCYGCSTCTPKPLASLHMHTRV
jgi:hypothetical protein